jgi:hypothetical protein
MTKWLLEILLIKLGIDIQPKRCYGITRRYLICAGVGWDLLYGVICVYQHVAFLALKRQIRPTHRLTFIDASMHHWV